jgi:hypothetical protein
LHVNIMVFRINQTNRPRRKSYIWIVCIEHIWIVCIEHIWILCIEHIWIVCIEHIWIVVLVNVQMFTNNSYMFNTNNSYMFNTNNSYMFNTNNSYMFNTNNSYMFNTNNSYMFNTNNSYIVEEETIFTLPPLSLSLSFVAAVCYIFQKLWTCLHIVSNINVIACNGIIRDVPCLFYPLSKLGKFTTFAYHWTCNYWGQLYTTWLST